MKENTQRGYVKECMSNPKSSLTRKFISTGVFVLAAVVCSCIDPYTPSTTSEDYAYLVVDGFFNPEEETIITLTHTQRIQDTSAVVTETTASVSVEENGGSTFPLTSYGNGTYHLAAGQAASGKDVRLHIKLTSGIEYASAYVPLKATPPIDSITWKLTDHSGAPGVGIYANTHDVTGTSQYYFWTYEETWEYGSRFISDWERIGDEIVPRSVDISHCWRNGVSTNLLIYSTTDLSSDQVSEFPLTFVSKFSPRVSYGYSLLVHQRVLTAEGYLYWQALQKNTENVGTVFGPLPSQITGNISCLSDPTLPAIGFFSASTESTTRFFVKNTQLPPVNAYQDDYAGCYGSDIFVPIAKALDPTTYLYLYPVEQGITIIGYQTAPPDCTDCRLKGGTIVKPDFWF